MRLNHVNLTVTDVRSAASFLETYFGLASMGGGNAGMDVLRDDDGFVLTLMKAGRGPHIYPGTFHIGFFVDSEATVDAVNERLRADGFNVAAPERHHAYGFYVSAPGGFTVELGA